MNSNVHRRKRIGIVLAVLLAVAVLCEVAVLRATLAQAAGGCDVQDASYTRKPKKEEKGTPDRGGTPEKWAHTLCGRLVYLTYAVPSGKGWVPLFVDGEKVHTIGLLPCHGGGKPYIFRIKPMDLLYYYQFRNVEFATGKRVCTMEYGCLDLYITMFQNYVGMDRCSDCGKYNRPPTWTHVPLTPFTATPIPPTQALIYPSSPTLTETPTPTLGTVTATPDLFDVLYGEPTPTATPTPATKPAVTSTLQPTVTATPTPFVAPGRSWFSPLGLGLLLLAGVALLAFWGWRTAARSEWG